MKLSVIIAAYNAEKYLAETLESVLHQTLDDYEVIAVNDGSVDDTSKILHAYEKEYPILHVIDQENGGPSAARNAGMDIAKGDYYYFLDGDDTLDGDSMEAMYNRAVEQQADMVVAGYDIFNKYQTFPVTNIADIIAQDEIERYERKLLWTFSLSNKLFRADKIRENNWRLPPISYSEDGVFTMNYILHADKITGLDKVVFHYRRMYEGEAESITSFVVPWKVQHYVTAHRMIYQQIIDSIARDFADGGTVEEIRENNEQANQYVNEFLRKEVQVLFNQFYSKFWALEDADTIHLICEEIERRIDEMDIRAVQLLQEAHPEMNIHQLCITQEEMLEKAIVTAVLYGDEAGREDFLKCLQSIELQNLSEIRIVVPEHMKEAVSAAQLQTGNLFYKECRSADELYYRMLAEADTDLIVFADPKIHYVNNAFKFAVKRFVKSPADFVGELIYHNGYGAPQPVYYNRLAAESFTCGVEYNEDLALDNTLANKFFRVSFLRSMISDTSVPMLMHLPQLIRRGYYQFVNDGVVIYDDEEESFPAFCDTKTARRSAEILCEDVPTASLSDPVFDREQERSYRKLQAMSRKNILAKIKRKAAIWLQRTLPVRNRVLFFTVRADGRLEGNAKALYPYVKSKKVVRAKMLPHSWLYALRMSYLTATSKVIVTDDYCKYLRHIGLRPEQRVVQLWHACGAFKKFGQRGTNLTIGTDMATHAQYNLVSVSGSGIRMIYADAFNISLRKVKALGCPRTDVFFDEEYKKNICERIYQKHPEFREKEILLYAPTFRDVNGERSNFVPELDFDELSKQLLPNQIFLICPHPVMTNEIIPHKFDNIFVCRDFATNDYMFISDMLITDYSSVIFEYALLGKPMAFFCYDLGAYNRGFYLRYPEDLPGDIYRGQEELFAYLRQPGLHRAGDKSEMFVQKYMNACDGHSAERIADLINRYMEETT